MCGLKLLTHGRNIGRIDHVTPYVGVWIETKLRLFGYKIFSVTPYVGVWIETKLRLFGYKIFSVTPYVGVWIETLITCFTSASIKSHPAWEYMDWSIVHSSVKFMEEL